jgi:hypothetical protein
MRHTDSGLVAGIKRGENKPLEGDLSDSRCRFDAGIFHEISAAVELGEQPLQPAPRFVGEREPLSPTEIGTKPGPDAAASITDHSPVPLPSRPPQVRAMRCNSSVIVPKVSYWVRAR